MMAVAAAQLHVCSFVRLAPGLEVDTGTAQKNIEKLKWKHHMRRPPPFRSRRVPVPCRSSGGWELTSRLGGRGGVDCRQPAVCIRSVAHSQAAWRGRAVIIQGHLREVPDQDHGRGKDTIGAGGPPALFHRGFSHDDVGECASRVREQSE